MSSKTPSQKHMNAQNTQELMTEIKALYHMLYEYQEDLIALQALAQRLRTSRRNQKKIETSLFILEARHARLKKALKEQLIQRYGSLRKFHEAEDHMTGTEQRLAALVTKLEYRLALKHSDRVMFQATLARLNQEHKQFKQRIGPSKQRREKRKELTDILLQLRDQICLEDLLKNNDFDSDIKQKIEQLWWRLGHLKRNESLQLSNFGLGKLSQLVYDEDVLCEYREKFQPDLHKDVS